MIMPSMINMQARPLMTSLPQRSFFNRGAKEEGKKSEEPKTNDTTKKEDVKEEAAKTESSDSEKETEFTKEDVKKIKQLFNEQEKEIEALNKMAEEFKAAIEK